MRIPLLFIYFIFIYPSGFIKAQQVYPYLNASTGNEGQYIVDSDTNIIMYHGNQIEKLDKNLNTIWVKQYDGLAFFSLLLSKTGSIYFISADSALTYNSHINIIGKLNADGTLNWCKQFASGSAIPTMPERFCDLMLDRNNNLVLSASYEYGSPTAWFLKLDTLGGVLSSKKFDLGGFALHNLKILQDSAGIYRFISGFWNFEFGGIIKFRYDENTNTITHFGWTGGVFSPTNAQSNFFKSKNDPSVYYSFQKINGLANATSGFVVKYQNDNIISANYYGLSAGPWFFNSFDEDEYGSIIYSISNDLVSSMGGYYHYTIKLNSTFTTGRSIQYFSNFSFTTPNWYTTIRGKIHALYGNKYIFDMYGGIFLSNPLTLTPIDSSLSVICKTSNSSAVNPSMGGSFDTNGPWSYQIINDTTTYTDLIPSVTAITNFSINNNYCLVNQSPEITKEAGSFFVYPNPASNALKVSVPDDQKIDKINIIDITGKIILSDNQETIDISDLKPGLYFIKVLTDKKEFKQKFVKE
ncbi:MAG: T9SS type A sorting domain-containing protein [Bacteroidota bacterium]